MPQTISPREIKIIIENVEEPVVFIGPPGIGKTYSVIEAAASMAKSSGKILVDLSGDTEATGIRAPKTIVPRTPRELVEVFKNVEKDPMKFFIYLRIPATQVTADDLQYPRLFGESAIVNAPPIKLAFLMVPGIEGILFLDEITNVKREDTRTAFFALINEKMVGLSGGLSGRVRVVAAGNAEEESSVAEPMPAPLANRFVFYYVRPPSAEEFIEFYERHCHMCDPSVTAFLSVNKNYIYVPPKDNELLENFPTPRSWHRLGKILPRLPTLELKMATAEGLLGPKVGAEFAAWLRLRPPTPEELLENPQLFEKLDFEQQVLASVTVARYLATANVRAAEKKAERLLRIMIDTNSEAAIVMLRTLASKSRTSFKLAYTIARRIGIDKIAVIKKMFDDIELSLT